MSRHLYLQNEHESEMLQYYAEANRAVRKTNPPPSIFTLPTQPLENDSPTAPSIPNNENWDAEKLDEVPMMY